MTGFGEGSAQNDRLEAVATLRGVNHRFLDVSVRLPDEYRAVESALIQRLKRALDRGRVELKVSVKSVGAREVAISVNEQAAETYIEASNRLAQHEGVERRLESGALLRLPEVVSVTALGGACSEDDAATVEEAVEKALAQLAAARSREGGELAKVLRRQVTDLGAVIAAISDLRAPLQEDLHTRLRQRMEELTGGVGLDPDRLAQEVALLVEKVDVQEEIDRLGLHVEHFGSVLDDEGAVGKRLDFLAQEILRELNTIGSKCRNSDASQLVLDGKVVCEQLREQVQNVE